MDGVFDPKFLETVPTNDLLNELDRRHDGFVAAMRFKDNGEHDPEDLYTSVYTSNTEFLVLCGLVSMLDKLLNLQYAESNTKKEED